MAMRKSYCFAQFALGAGHLLITLIALVGERLVVDVVLITSREFR